MYSINKGFCKVLSGKRILKLTIIENQSSVADNNRSKPDLILFSYLIWSISCFSTTSDRKIRLPTNVRSLNNKYDQTLIKNHES